MNAEGDQPVPEPPADSDEEDEAPSLAARAGDDLSTGTSVSGVGGEHLRVEKREAGLPPVHEQAERLGWGQDEHPDDPMSEDVLGEGS